MALTDKLVAIADAIREKTDKTDKMTLNQMAVEIGGITGGGTTDHSQLINRDLADQHPIGAITGLEEALTPLTGTTGTLTPMQVYDAIKSGKSVVLQHTHSLRGMFTFASFNIFGEEKTVVSTSIEKTGYTYLVGSLVGDAMHNVWNFNITEMAEADDIPVAVNNALAQAKESGEFDGAAGKSAYAYAQDGGYTGTETEFAAKLAKEKFANPYALTFTGAVAGSYDGSAPLSVEIPSGGGNKGWTLLYDGTITINEAVKTVTESLLSPCDGMVDFIGYISWTANANTESGMDDISISVGEANMDYGRIGKASNAGNTIFQATVTSSRTYWGRATTSNTLLYNIVQMQYCFSENAKNANYENVSIGFFAKTYAGTITLQLYGR